MRRVAVVLAVCLTIAACVGRVQSVEEDRRMGREVAQQVPRQVGLVEGGPAVRCVEQVGRRLEGVLEDSRFEFRFAVLDDPTPNAFAAPGGYVYVSRGLLLLVDSEDELAGVLGHEMMHVSHRHSAKQMARRSPGLLSLPGRAVGAVVSEDLGKLINAPVDNIGGLFAASYSRGHETDADESGLALSAKCGYDPAAMAGLLRRMEDEMLVLTGKERKKSFFDTHPTTPTRVADIRERAAATPWTRTSGITKDRVDLLRRLDGLVIGPNPATGLFRENRFLHPDLDVAVDFPPGWETVNTPLAAGATAPKQDGLAFMGIAARGSTAKAVGSAFRVDFEKRFELTATRAEEPDVNGRKGYLLVYSEGAGRDAMSIYFLWFEDRDLVIQMIGVAPERHRPLLRSTALSFRRLTAEERRSIEAVRLRIVIAKEGETLADVAKRTGCSFQPEIRAIVNGRANDEPLPTGAPVKVAKREPY